MLASSAVTPSTASMTTTATSARSRLLRAITTESFSAISSVLPLRRMPAVSMSRKVRPSASRTVSTASRVVPATGETMTRSVAEESVEQRRLPDVRAAHDGEPHLARSFFGLRIFIRRFLRREPFHERVEQLGYAVAVLGRDGQHVLEAEAMELARECFELGGVHLVGDDEHRLPRRAQQTRQLFIERRRARARIHDPEEHDRLVDGELGLPENVRRDEFLVVGHDTARVHEREAPPRPLRLAVDAVARDPRLVADDGTPLADQPVEERGLPHVRPPDNRHQRQRRCPPASLLCSLDILN